MESDSFSPAANQYSQMGAEKTWRAANKVLCLQSVESIRTKQDNSSHLYDKEYARNRPARPAATRSSLGRACLGRGLFALEIASASLAFFDFIVLLAHKSLLSADDSVV